MKDPNMMEEGQGEGEVESAQEDAAEPIVTIKKGPNYPEGLGKVGDTGSLEYEVVEENDKVCRIRITGVEHETEEEEAGEEEGKNMNAGEAFDKFAKSQRSPPEDIRNNTGGGY